MNIKVPPEFSHMTLGAVLQLAEKYDGYVVLRELTHGKSLDSHYSASELALFKSFDTDQHLHSAMQTLHDQNQMLAMKSASMPSISRDKGDGLKYNPADQLLHGLNNVVTGGLTGAIAQNIAAHFHPADIVNQNKLADALITIGGFATSAASLPAQKDSATKNVESASNAKSDAAAASGKPSPSDKESISQKVGELLSDPLNKSLAGSPDPSKGKALHDKQGEKGFGKDHVPDHGDGGH